MQCQWGLGLLSYPASQNIWSGGPSFTNSRKRPSRDVLSFNAVKYYFIHLATPDWLHYSSSLGFQQDITAVVLIALDERGASRPDHLMQIGCSPFANRMARLIDAEQRSASY